LGQSFFGLPRSDDPNLQKFCSQQQLRILTEIRYVMEEVGSYEEARRLPTEVRNWWISEMRKEAERLAGNPNAPSDGRTVIRDVPKVIRGR
jgi:hypothetical protein